MVRESISIRRFRPPAALYLFGLAFALGALAIFSSQDETPNFAPTERESQIADLLQWIPATDQTERGYAVWVSLPEAPLGVADAINRLSIVPVPLALGRSVEFQQTTGISASQVTGWAAAHEAGVSVLAGQFDRQAVSVTLEGGGYEEDVYRGVSIWMAPDQRDSSLIVQGDDLRALNVVALAEDRLLVAHTRLAAEQALDAASGRVDNLADRADPRELPGVGELAGFMVVDQRDLAVDCGVAGQWRKTDFSDSSDRTVGIVYRLDPDDRAPVTTVWTDLGDEVVAEAGLFTFDDGWRHGFVNQIGLGGPVSALATIQAVRRSGTLVVADLVQGRDNGWVRSGVRYLVDICEQSSAVVPAGQPIRETPLASPSPEERQ